MRGMRRRGERVVLGIRGKVSVMECDTRSPAGQGPTGKEGKLRPPSFLGFARPEAVELI
jgi:hypothetical protein